MQKTLLSSVALVALTGFANAADMPLKAAPHYAVSETVALPFNSAHDGYRVGPGTGDHVTFGDVDVVRVNLSYLFNWGYR
jgi:hypothetical protein